MKYLFVPYKTSKSLREKGFDEDCLGGYSVTDEHKFEFLFRISQLPIEKNSQCFHVLAPTYQQVIDWFREKHNIEIHIYNAAAGHHWQCLLRSYPSSELLKTVSPPKNWNIKSYYDYLEQAIIEAISFIKN